MKKNLLIIVLIAALFSLLAWVGISMRTVTQPLFGNTYPFAGQTYNLAGSGVSGSATSIILTSLTIKQTGQAVKTADLVGTGGTYYVTLEPGSNAKQEIVGCTGVSGSTLTGCTRGLSPIYPYTASSTLQFTHAGGAAVIFSDPPQLFQQFYALANAGTSTNTLVFTSTTPPHYDTPGAQAAGTYISTTSEFVSWAGLAAVTAAGTVNATNAVKGILQVATALQQASSTALGSTGASLALTTATATDTPQRGCAVGFTATAGAGCNIIADLTGHLKQAWLDLTAAYTMTGAWIFQGTVNILATAAKPLTLNSLAYVFPASRQATSTVLSEDGTGNLSWEPLQVGVVTKDTTSASTGNTSTTTLATWAIPANTIGTNGTFRYTVYLSGSGSTNRKCIEVNFGNGTSATTTVGAVCASGNQSGNDIDSGVLTGTIRNLNSASSQISAGVGTGNPNPSASTTPTMYLVTRASTINTAAVTYINVRGSAPGGGSGDTVIEKGMTIEALP